MSITAAVLAFATSFAAWYIERHEQRVVYPFDATYTAAAAAGEARLAETWFETPDGERLVVWSAPARPDRPTVLYLPGNAGTLADRSRRLSWLLDRGLGLTSFGYRGSSGSTGRPDEAVLTQDARAIGAALRDDEDVRQHGLVIFGESFGAALAVKLAADGLGDAVVLESPFTSIADLVGAQFPGEDLADIFTERWETRRAIAKVAQPLLVLHGTADRLVPLEQGREVHARAGSDDKSLIVMHGVGHAGAWSPIGLAALQSFLSGL